MRLYVVVRWEKYSSAEGFSGLRDGGGSLRYIPNLDDVV